jgi:hypothetical protein
MEDPTASERFQSQKRLEELYVRGLLDSSYISLNDNNKVGRILNHIDCFVEESQGNSRVQQLYLRLSALNGHDDNVWDKLGQAVGNLQGLKILIISTLCTHSRTFDFVVPIPAWEKLALILSRVQQKVSIDLYDRSDVWTVGDVRAFARVIRGQPMITRFESGKLLPAESLDTLYSALATLPNLESIKLYNRGRHTMAEGESLTELLQAPALRSVDFGDDFGDGFGDYFFTPVYCQALANAFMEGAAITRLQFTRCSFAAGECATLADAFSRNTSVSYIRVAKPRDQALYSALTTALPLNSTLQELSFEDLASDDPDAFSFLRTNNVLKSLKITLDPRVTKSRVAAFRNDIAAMLQENESLESLSIHSNVLITAEEYIALVTVLKHNTTLKALDFFYREGRQRLTDAEDKQMAALLKKNYAMESLDIYLERKAGDVGAILRLNQAGRRYLVEDGSSVSEGVKVLSAVRSDINCVFFHLLENPRLCNRSAVEVASERTEERRGSANPASR